MSLCGGLRLIKNRVERQCEFVKEQRVNELVNVSCGRVMYSFLLSCFVIESTKIAPKIVGLMGDQSNSAMS